MSDITRRDLSRRDLLKGAALAGAAIAAGGALPTAVAAAGAFHPAIAENVDAIAHPDLAPPAPARRATMRAVPFERHETVRIGMVGTGLRGRSVLGELLALENVKIVAICDVVADKMAKATKKITDAGHPAPATYGDGDHAFEALVKRDDIDFVYTATPWEWHVPVMLAALNAGKHCGSECPIGTTLKDLWALVDASEKARRHCLHLENCCYGETEMMVNRMVHDGVFGELLHAEAAYLHDLREILFENRDEGLWRRAWHTRANANLYPTHGLGPVAWYLDIHAGDRFDYIASVAGPERGLEVYREATVKDHADPKWQREVHHGRPQHVDHPHGEGPDDHAPARRVQPAPVHAAQPRAGNEGRVRGLSAAGVRGGPEGRRALGRRSIRGRRRTRTRCGRSWASAPARPAARAAWTSSWRTGSCSACTRGSFPTTTCTTPRRGARRSRSPRCRSPRAARR